MRKLRDVTRRILVVSTVSWYGLPSISTKLGKNSKGTGDQSRHCNDDPARHCARVLASLHEDYPRFNHSRFGTAGCLRRKQPLSDSPRPRLIAVRVGLPVVIVVVLAHQFAKYAVMHWLNLQTRGVLEVLPFLDFAWVTNHGTAMGVIAMSEDPSRWILIAFTSIVSLVVLYLLLRARRWSDGAALGLILGGAIGNLIDRLRYGYVVDFIHVHYGSLGFYVFNVADAAITIGAIWMAVNYQLFGRAQTKSRAPH